jgi:hypothetical protein
MIDDVRQLDFMQEILEMDWNALKSWKNYVDTLKKWAQHDELRFWFAAIEASYTVPVGEKNSGHGLEVLSVTISKTAHTLAPFHQKLQEKAPNLMFVNEMREEPIPTRSA